MDAVARNGQKTVLDFAMSYLGSGLSILPILRDGTKASAVKWGIYGSGVKNDQTGQIVEPSRLMTDAEAVRFFGGNKPYGIALAGGKISGNLEVIDFDYRAEANVVEWIFAVECECPGLIERLTQIQTPRSEHARHFWYRCPEVLITGNLKLAEEPLRPQGKRAMIETRGEGGYALAPGSPAECHDTGRCYVHVAGPPLTEVPVITAKEREILFRCANFLDLVHKVADQDSNSLRNGQLLPGTDFIQRGPDWSEILEPHGWVCERRSGEARYWRRPGKEKGISATTGICISKNGTPLFCVFSSNAFPFEGSANGKNCSSYHKFAAYAMLNHGGDFSAAAADLQSKGFGTPLQTGPVAAVIEDAERKIKDKQAEKDEAKKRLEELNREIGDLNGQVKDAEKEKKSSEKKRQQEEIRIGFSALGFSFDNGEWHPGQWRVIIIKAEPPMYRLHAPFLDKGIVLSDDQFDSPTLVHKVILRATGNICLADRPQAWSCLWDGYKNIRAMKAKLLDAAEEEEAPAEIKRSVVVAQWLFKRLQHGRQVKDRSEIDGHGGAYRLDDGSVVFDFTHVWTEGAKSEDKIKRPEMSKLLKELNKETCWRGKKLFDVLNKESLEALESMLKPDQPPKTP